MKKAFLLPLMLLALASCSGGKAPANMAEVNKLKALLAKQDLSPVLTKMFVSNFTQDYEVYSSSRDEEEGPETQFYSYRGGGVVGCLYEVSDATYEEVEALESHDFFDYLFRGKGSYGMLQTATLLSYSDESEEGETLETMGFLQRLETLFSEDSLQVYNSLSYKEQLTGSYDHRQTLNAIIDKAALFDAITPRAFSDIFARTNLYDGQRSVETLDRIYFSLVSELAEKSDRELGAFIAENAISIEEGEENLLVHFKAESGHLRSVLEQNDIIPGAFEGTLTYEKESGAFSAFDYRILYVVNEADENGNLRTASMEFKADGYSWNQRYEEDLYIEPNPTVYEDPEAFLEDVVDKVIPPFI